MKKAKTDLKKECVNTWIQAVRAYAKWKDDPSAQCAWDILKILIKILVYIIKLRLMQQPDQEERSTLPAQSGRVGNLAFS